MTEQSTGASQRDVNSIVVVRVGKVAPSTAAAGFEVRDVAGQSVAEIDDFLATLVAGASGRNAARSYALALLRWWRFLAAIDVTWQAAGRVEVRDFVVWMRFVARPRFTSAGAAAAEAAGADPAGVAGPHVRRLFAVVGCDRDRALLAFWISTGARASELLGVSLDDVDAGTQRIAVMRKGSGRVQWLPASVFLNRSP